MSEFIYDKQTGLLEFVNDIGEVYRTKIEPNLTFDELIDRLVEAMKDPRPLNEN